MTFFFWCCTIPAGLNDTYIFYLKETFFIISIYFQWFFLGFVTSYFLLGNVY